MNRRTCMLRLFVVPAVLAAAHPAAADRPDYPPTRVEPVREVLHGVEIVDPYRWLENSDDPEVRAWTDQQNALTRRYLDQFADQADRIRARLKELFRATSTSSPSVYGDRYFFFRRSGDQNHAVLYVREGSYKAEPRVVLDPNTFSKDGTVALDWLHPSPDGRLIAYGKSASGSELSTLYVLDVETGKHLEDTIPRTRACALAWEPDAGGFYYTRYPSPGDVPPGDENYYRNVFYHRLGSDWHDDPLVYGEGRPKEEWKDVETSSDHRWMFLALSLDWAKNDLYIRDLTRPSEFVPIAVGLDGRFSGDVAGDRLYLLTDYQAPRYRILATSVEHPDIASAKEIIPQSSGVIEAFRIIGRYLVVLVSENAYSRLFVHNLDGERLYEIKLPALGTVAGLSGRHDGHDLFFTFTSFVYPSSVYHVDLNTKELELLDRLDVEIDSDQYVTRQVWYRSKDGTRVPMFLVHRKGIERNGRNPTLLYGYGGFNISITPSFRMTVMPWLEAGGVYAVANIRGGGEFGRQWHQAGRRENKQNVFDDFIAAAEWLIENRYTSPQRLAIYGGSNGGLLVGAVEVQRPDLFQAVICAVPLLDMIRYHHFSIARLWIPEYGSAEDPEQFKWLYAYSPYHHVREGVAYPATLLMTAESDTRVDPMHARKMAARLQAATSSDRPILLRMETKAGHGAGRPVSKTIDNATDMLVFTMWQLGMFDRTAPEPKAAEPAVPRG